VLHSLSTNTEIHKPLIRPLLNYGCDAWAATQPPEEKLAISEREIQVESLDQSKKNDLGWRPRQSEELYELLDGPDA
jgi:hypothetical protein